jgi:tetratricopeptide (TPR) repeat protein
MLFPVLATGQETVQSLRYGVSLYHYFQEDYFEALSELMVGQARSELGEHGAGSELLRGGMSLSYGMDRQAQQIFTQQLALDPQHRDRDRAWFFLGKAAWQRGDIERAMAALDKVSPEADKEMRREALYLLASGHLRRGEDDKALVLLDELPEHSLWRYYLHYNAAARSAAREDWASAQAHFEPFDTMEVGNREDLALYERAHTAAGYAFLSADQPIRARAAFEQVGLAGMAAEQALLGYGWAAVREGQYLDALRAWQPLTQRSMLNATARESLMAVPYAYEQLGETGAALAQYRNASAVYETQLADLDLAIAAFSTEPVGALLGLEDVTGEEAAVMGWLEAATIEPRGDFAPYLQFLSTRHSFQVALRELRDLYDMRRRLVRAQARLAVLREVDAHQQAAWSSVVREDRRSVLSRRADALEEQHRAVRERVAQAVDSGDVRALADAASSARWARLERASAAAADLDRPQQADRLRLLRGLQYWEDSEALPARVWEARRALKDLALALDVTRDALFAVDRALEHRSTGSEVERIEALEQAVADHLARVESVLGRAESDTRSLAVAALEEQAVALRRGLGQSSLAIARLYDLGHGGLAP